MTRTRYTALALAAATLTLTSACERSQPADTPETDAPAAARATPTHARTDFDGHTIHYTLLGRGDKTPIVFVHGWSSARTFWRYQMDESPDDAFTDRPRLALDLIGHGDSDAPEIEYTMDLFARSVAAAMDDAGIDRAVLVGHSNGTPVIRQFYRLFPDRTAALVVVDGALRAWTDDPSLIEQMAAQFQTPLYRDAAEQFITPMLQAMHNPDDREHVRERILQTPQHVMVGGFTASADPDIWREDPIEVPLLVVIAESEWFPPDYEDFVHTLAPDAEFHKWQGFSHFLMMDDPHRFNETLAAFLNAQNL